MMPSHARVVIVGGGIVGCSVLYHLAKAGWKDCVLIEKAELTSGSTWHAAGAATYSLASETIARMGKYSIDLYKTLEAETEQSVSWHGCGSLRLAYTDDELDYLRHILSIGRGLNHSLEIIGPDDIRVLHPFYNCDKIKAAIHAPLDGHLDPAGATMALAKGARQNGAKVIRYNRVLNIEKLANGEWRVITEQGEITCEIVVNAGGTYARQIGQWVGLDLPIMCSAHQYLITDAIPELAALPQELPIVRDAYQVSAYCRQEQASVLLGVYTDPHPVWLQGTPWESVNELFSEDFDGIMPSLEIVMERYPLIAQHGIKQVINGAIPYVPDGSMLLGPAPGLHNFWCACGVSVGIAWGPGVGKYLAQWIMHGSAEVNMRQFDPRRFGPWADYNYAVKKVKEDYILRHKVPFPGLDRPAGRPVRKSALYEQLKQQGAVFEQMAGWERPSWFASGITQQHYHGFRATPATEMVAREVKIVREKAGLLDLSGFSKLFVSGPDAKSLLARVTSNKMPEVGRTVLTYLLNRNGKIETEITCTRLGEDNFYLLFSALEEIKVVDWLDQHKVDGEAVAVENVSDLVGVLVIAGPLAQQILESVTQSSFSKQQFPYFSTKEITIADKTVRALHVSIVGEPGWELHTAMVDLPDVYAALWQVGQPLGIDNFGTAALTTMRIESGIMGARELNATATLREAGMMRFCKLDKDTFIGKDAIMAAEEMPLTHVFVQLIIDSNDNICHGSEAVFSDKGEVVGSITSGTFGPDANKISAFAYVKKDYAEPGTILHVMLLGENYVARVFALSAHDS